MNAFQSIRPPDQDNLFEGVPVSLQTVEAIEKALEDHNRGVLPIILAAAIISLCLSILGFFSLLPKTENLALFAILAGFATALLNSGFWTFMFKRASDAKTRMGVTVIAAMFFIGGAIATLPSTGTNLAGFIAGASNFVSQASQIEFFATTIQKTNQISTQLTNLLNALKSNEASYAKRYTDEIKGRGITRKPGEGFVSNAFLEAKNLFANQTLALENALKEFQKLKPELDGKFAKWQEAQRSGDYKEKGFDEARTEIASLIAQIIAINPKSVAANIADQIDINISLPNGAKRFQVEAIESIRSEITTIAKNFRSTANGFAPIDVPEKEVTSKIVLAWQNAFQFWPMTILAIGIDLIAPLLFLMKLPGYLAIHAQQKALHARKSHIRNELGYHRAPKSSDIYGVILSDVKEIIALHNGFQRQIVDMSVHGIESLPLEKDFYADLESNDEKEIVDVEFEDFWEGDDFDEDEPNGESQPDVDGERNNGEDQ